MHCYKCILFVLPFLYRISSPLRTNDFLISYLIFNIYICYIFTCVQLQEISEFSQRLQQSSHSNERKIGFMFSYKIFITSTQGDEIDKSSLISSGHKDSYIDNFETGRPNLINEIKEFYQSLCCQSQIDQELNSDYSDIVRGNNEYQVVDETLTIKQLKKDSLLFTCGPSSLTKECFDISVREGISFKSEAFLL